MNWFKKHLNLTLLFVWVFLNGYLFLVRTYESNFNILVALIIPAVILMWATEIWYLHEKQRSYWFMLLNIAYIIGFAAMINLDNHRKGDDYGN